MAIALEFINFIVLRSRIASRYPGGWGQCLRDHRSVLGKRVFYDAHLFRDGAMGPDGIQALLDIWTQRGFTPSITVDGQETAMDVCVIDVFGGQLWPCVWIERPSAFVAYRADREPGRLVGPAWVRQAVARREADRRLRAICDSSKGITK